MNSLIKEQVHRRLTIATNICTIHHYPSNMNEERKMTRFLSALAIILPFFGYAQAGSSNAHDSSATVTIDITSTIKGKEVEVSVDYFPGETTIITKMTPMRLTLRTDRLYAIIRNNTPGTQFTVSAVQTMGNGVEGGRLKADGSSTIALHVTTTKGDMNSIAAK